MLPATGTAVAMSTGSAPGSASAGTVAGSSPKTARAGASDPLAGTSFATGSLVVAIPAPTLTTTPATQGPVTVGSSVTWTLTYGNTGAGALQNAVLEDTLPGGYTYVSSASSPSLPAPTVIPAASGTIVRWNVGSIAAQTSPAGSVTITARTGAITEGTGTPPHQTFANEATLVGRDTTGTEISAAPASASVLEQAGDLTLGKSVDKTFIGTLPNTLTYTLSPRSDNAEPLENVRVIDPYPVGLTAPPIAVGQGGTYGPYAPIAALPGSDPGPPALNTAMSVSTNFVIQGGTVTVTLNVKSSVAVSNVSPSDLDLNGGIAVCPGPSPLVANVPAGGAGVNFTWTCTLAQLGEYVFTADAADLTDTTSWPAASSASVLSAAGGGPNVVTWNLGSNTRCGPGADDHQRLHGRRVRLPRRGHDHVPQVRHR